MQIFPRALFAVILLIKRINPKTFANSLLGLWAVSWVWLRRPTKLSVSSVWLHCVSVSTVILLLDISQRTHPSAIKSKISTDSAQQTWCPSNQLPVQCLSYCSLKLTTWLGIFRFSFIRRLGELHWIQFHWMKIHRYVSQLLGFNTQICIAFLIKFPESSQLLQLFRTEIRYSIPWRGNSFSLKYDHFHSQLLR